MSDKEDPAGANDVDYGAAGCMFFLSAVGLGLMLVLMALAYRLAMGW